MIDYRYAYRTFDKSEPHRPQMTLPRLNTQRAPQKFAVPIVCSEFCYLLGGGIDGRYATLGVDEHGAQLSAFKAIVVPQ